MPERSLVIKVTAGKDDPERCNQAFNVAATAVASGVAVSLWLAGESTWFALPGRAEDFSLPPRGEAEGRLKGVVTDGDSGLPLQGVIVQFGGHNSGFTGTLAGVSDARGRYEIRRILAGTYPKVSASGGAGYDPVLRTPLHLACPSIVITFAAYKFS